MESVLWGLALHVVWLLMGDRVFGEAFRADTLLELLASTAEEQHRAIVSIQNNLTGVARYFISLYAAALLVPAALRFAITKLRLDRTGRWFSPYFRFNQAPWYYLLTGADFLDKGDVDYIQVAAVVNVAGAPVLFTGVLDDFFFDADGQLDRLVLEAMTRRPFDRDKSDSDPGTSDRFYSIDGDYFVIKYAEIITLNIQYIKLVPDTSSAGSVSGDAAS
jgi:hypothetical protein